MKPELTDVRGIGPNTAEVLEAQGIRSVTALANANADQVSAAPGFGQIRAAEVITAAVALLAAVDGVQIATETAEPSKDKNKSSRKASSKKKQKEKKNNKKKKNGKKKKSKKKKSKKK